MSNLIFTDSVYAVDMDNVDIIIPIHNKDGAIETVEIFTKSKNCLTLSLEQYRQLLDEYKTIMRYIFNKDGK